MGLSGKKIVFINSLNKTSRIGNCQPFIVNTKSYRAHFRIITVTECINHSFPECLMIKIRDIYMNKTTLYFMIGVPRLH